MINKNICEDIWLCFLDQIGVYEFKKEYEYIRNIIIGIYINDNGKLKFNTVEGVSLGWDKVDFRIIEDITKDIFPKLDCKEVNRIQNTIVYLRRLRSDLDLCYNDLLGDDYKEFLDNLDDKLLEYINSAILNIINYK